MATTDIQRQHTILFDGVCNLCNSSVNFILRHESSALFQFASIQSETGKALLQWCGLPEEFSEAVIYIEKGKVHQGSTAALKIGQRLKFPWSVISLIGLMISIFFRDWVYNQIATHRYQWFGKKLFA